MNKPRKWSPTDPKHFEGKSIRALQDELVRATTFSKDYPEFELGWHNEYIQELKRRLAESIGKVRK